MLDRVAEIDAPSEDQCLLNVCMLDEVHNIGSHVYRSVNCYLVNAIHKGAESNDGVKSSQWP